METEIFAHSGTGDVDSTHGRCTLALILSVVQIRDDRATRARPNAFRVKWYLQTCVPRDRCRNDTLMVSAHAAYARAY